MTIMYVAEKDHPARHHHPLANRCVLALLRSPVHTLLDPGLCELRFQGRHSGRTVALPVLWAQTGQRLVVLVGDAPNKTWWRNFLTPGPIEVLRNGTAQPGTGRILRPVEAVYVEAAGVYAGRHGLQPQPTDRLLVIDLSEGV